MATCAFMYKQFFPYNIRNKQKMNSKSTETEDVIHDFLASSLCFCLIFN